MTTEIMPALLWAAAGAVGMAALWWLAQGLVKLGERRKRRRRRNAKPWRKSAEPPKIEIAHQQRTKASIGKAPARKTRARIGVHHKTNR